jgi:hypothetical protein
MLRMLSPRHRQVNGNITISTIEKFNKNLGSDYLQESYRNLARPSDSPASGSAPRLGITLTSTFWRLGLSGFRCVSICTNRHTTSKKGNCAQNLKKVLLTSANLPLYLQVSLPGPG